MDDRLLMALAVVAVAVAVAATVLMLDELTSKFGRMMNNVKQEQKAFTGKGEDSHNDVTSLRVVNKALASLVLFFLAVAAAQAHQAWLSTPGVLGPEHGQGHKLGGNLIVSAIEAAREYVHAPAHDTETTLPIIFWFGDGEAGRKGVETNPAPGLTFRIGTISSEENTNLTLGWRSISSRVSSAATIFSIEYDDTITADDSNTAARRNTYELRCKLITGSKKVEITWGDDYYYHKEFTHVGKGFGLASFTQWHPCTHNNEQVVVSETDGIYLETSREDIIGDNYGKALSFKLLLVALAAAVTLEAWMSPPVGFRYLSANKNATPRSSTFDDIDQLKRFSNNFQQGMLGRGEFGKVYSSDLLLQHATRVGTTEDGSSMVKNIRKNRNPMRHVVHAAPHVRIIVDIVLSVLISTIVPYNQESRTSAAAVLCIYLIVMLMVITIYICIILNDANTPTLGMTRGGDICASESHPAAADEDIPNTAAPSGSTRDPKWNVASAAVHHMTGNRSLLLTGSYSHMDDSGENQIVVHMANNSGEPLRVHGSGSVRTGSIALDDVWYVPGLVSNLVSTGQLARLGCSITLGPDGCRITKGDALVGTARFADGYLFELDFLKVASSK